MCVHKCQKVAWYSLAAVNLGFVQIAGSLFYIKLQIFLS